MADVKIELDADTIQKEVTSAIVQSAIGANIAEAVKRALNSASWGSRSPVTTAIESEVQRIVATLIREEYNEQITEAVRKHMTDSMVTEITQKAMDAFIDKLSQA